MIERLFAVAFYADVYGVRDRLNAEYAEAAIEEATNKYGDAVKAVVRITKETVWQRKDGGQLKAMKKLQRSVTKVG